MGLQRECVGVLLAIFKHFAAIYRVMMVLRLAVYSCGSPVIGITTDVVPIVETLGDAAWWWLSWVLLEMRWEWLSWWMLDELPRHALGGILL